MAKLDITKLPIKTKKKKVIIKPLKTPKYLENELSNFLKFMAKTIHTRFENKVLKELKKEKIKNKFQDTSTVGNYSVIYNRLVSEYKKSIDKQFNKKRLQKYIIMLYSRINKINDKKFYNNVKNEVGIDMKQILKTDGLNSFVNAKSLETLNQIIKLKNDSVLNYTTNVQRLMSAGKNLDTLYQEVTNRKKQNLNKSELVARNELKTFNSQLSDKRADNLGIKKAVWNSVGDERSRKCHKARDGQEYDIKKGCYSSCDDEYLVAGQPINCRCYNTYIVEFD